MAEAIKLPSGKWCCTVFLGRDANGKKIRKSFTARLKKDAEAMAENYKSLNKQFISEVDALDYSVDIVCQLYLQKMKEQVKAGIKSPSTIRGYNSVYENHIKGSFLADIKLRKLEKKHVMKWIEALEMSGLSAKAVKNDYSVLHAALLEYMPSICSWGKMVKQPAKKKPYTPTDADIEKILDHFEATDHDMYVACLLGAYGTLRRSEICALTSDDVDYENNTVHVNKACVTDGEKWYPDSKPKTEGSNRKINLPAFVIAELPKEGNLVTIDPTIVTNRFIRARKRLGLDQVRFHDLRHYTASALHALNIPDAYIMKKGGWDDAKTLHDHYIGVMKDHEEILDRLANEYFTERQNNRKKKKTTAFCPNVVQIERKRASTL